MKWLFSPPFLSVSPFLLLNLVRRQCYAYAIGLYTRPEIKSWPDVKFCAHAHCVLPRCCLHITYINSKPASLGFKGRNGGRSRGDGTRSKLVGQFSSFFAIFYHYGNMRTSSKTHKFLGKACSKNNSLREWVDWRVQHIWRLPVIGSWQRLIPIQLIQSRVYFFGFLFLRSIFSTVTLHE